MKRKTISMHRHHANRSGKRRRQPKQSAEHRIRDFFRGFVTWLSNQGRISMKEKVDVTFERFEPLQRDETMKVDNETSVRFNTDYLNLKSCHVDYFITIVLHEAFHFYVNGIPNKKDAIRIKDNYDAATMMQIDVEADYYVAKYFKEERHLGLKDYLMVYHGGATTFRDDEIRPLKLERYISTMLTIAHLHLYGDFALYRLSLIAAEVCAKPQALVRKGGHTEFRRLELGQTELDALKRLYQHPERFSEEEYVEELSVILTKAINDPKVEALSPKVKFVG